MHCCLQVALLTSYDFILEALFDAALWRIGISFILIGFADSLGDFPKADTDQIRLS